MIMIMVLGTLVMTGCGGSSDKSADKDTLVVGLDDTFAPMGFRDEKGRPRRIRYRPGKCRR